MGTKYHYKDKVIFVMRGMGTGPFITGYLSKSGGSHRIKSPALPLCETQEEAQKHLDAWASAHKLEIAEEYHG